MKYKYNGQWVDVNIKALDSMPVGTMVEFAGGTIPSGWTQVNDYSTDEIDTGKTWIDGKEIYRKVIEKTITATGTTNIAMNITNADFIMMPYWQYASSGYTFVFGFEGNGVNAWMSGTTIVFVTDAFNNGTFTAIIEYTKTTNQE